MILLLGASGYIGQAFAAELDARGMGFWALSRSEEDYTSFQKLRDILERSRPEFVINAAGHIGRPNVDACEAQRAESLLGNAMLPQTAAHACDATGTPWGHVSSGCIYNGAKVEVNGEWRVETDLSRPEAEETFQNHPERFRGFSEEDAPNFSFRAPPCSFYSGTKALGEEVVQQSERAYIWRLRIPFDEYDGARNYLSKLMRYPRVYQNINSLSHRGDFAKACLDLWELRAPFGIYNVTNPGAVSTRAVVRKIQEVLRPAREFEFWNDDAEFYREAVTTPRSNCILDTTKIRDAGVRLRPVWDAVEEALWSWKTEWCATPNREEQKGESQACHLDGQIRLS